MGNLLKDSDRIYAHLKSVVKNILSAETRNCVRTYKAIIVQAPDGAECKVRLAGDQTVLTVSCSDIADIEVGDTVWVVTVNDSFRNAMLLPSAYTGEAIARFG